MVEILCMKVMETKTRFESVTKCICRSISFKRNAFVGQWGFSFKPFLFQLWKLIWLKWQTNFNHGVTLVTSEHVFCHHSSYHIGHILLVVSVQDCRGTRKVGMMKDSAPKAWGKRKLAISRKLGLWGNWTFVWLLSSQQNLSSNNQNYKKLPDSNLQTFAFSKISSDRHNHVHVGKMKEKANTRHHQPIVDNTKTRQSASLKTRFSVVAIIDDLCNCIMRFTRMTMMMPK